MDSKKTISKAGSEQYTQWVTICVKKGKLKVYRISQKSLWKDIQEGMYIALYILNFEPHDSTA